jgi:hypothetical protein
VNWAEKIILQPCTQSVRSLMSPKSMLHYAVQLQRLRNIYMLKSICVSWGIVVDCLLVSCGRTSDFCAGLAGKVALVWTKTSVSTLNSSCFYMLFSPTKMREINLLDSYLYPLSTPPITTTTFILINSYSICNPRSC